MFFEKYDVEKNDKNPKTSGKFTYPWEVKSKETGKVEHLSEKGFELFSKKNK